SSDDMSMNKLTSPSTQTWRGMRGGGSIFMGRHCAGVRHHRAGRCNPATALLAYLCLASAMALVGSYVGLSKLLVAVFPVFLLAWLRFGIAAVAMLHWVKRPPAEAPLSRRDRVLLFWESFLGNFLFSVFMLFGVALSTALAAGVIMAAI